MTFNKISAAPPSSVFRCKTEYPSANAVLLQYGPTPDEFKPAITSAIQAFPGKRNIGKTLTLMIEEHPDGHTTTYASRSGTFSDAQIVSHSHRCSQQGVTFAATSAREVLKPSEKVTSTGDNNQMHPISLFVHFLQNVCLNIDKDDFWATYEAYFGLTPEDKHIFQQIFALYKAPDIRAAFESQSHKHNILDFISKLVLASVFDKRFVEAANQIGTISLTDLNTGAALPTGPIEYQNAPIIARLTDSGPIIESIRPGLTNIWDRFQHWDAVSISTIFSHCGEDNLIEYLRTQSVSSASRKTIFSIRMTADGNIDEIEAPCDNCVAHFNEHFGVATALETGDRVTSAAVPIKPVPPDVIAAILKAEAKE